MTLDPVRVLGTPMPDRRYRWSKRDTILYALGAGCDADDLPFVYDRDLVTLPTFVTLVCNVPMFDPVALGLDYAGLVHAAQSITLHRPIAPEGEAVLSKRVAGLWDRGSERGAVLAVETLVRDAVTGELLATVVNEMLARRNGGFGGAPPTAHDRAPLAATAARDMPTRADQALLFRLSGDWNPLHADPEVARAAGFPAPILHGMCTYAICARALLAEYALPAEALRDFSARFRAPVYPGETLTVEMARSGATIDFTARVGDRQVVRDGRAVLRS